MPALRDSKGRFISASASAGGVGMAVTIETNFRRIEQKVEAATFKNLRHAAFSLRKHVVESIKKDDEPSEPGSPPTTRGRGGHNLRGAIFVSATKDQAIIGPRASYVATSGSLHEFGKSRKRQRFKKRPFMRPGLEASLPRFIDEWRSSIGE